MIRLPMSTIDFYVWKSPEKGGTGHFGTGYTTPNERRYHAVQPGRSVMSLFAPTFFGAVTGTPCPSQVIDSLKQDEANEGGKPDYIVRFPADSETIQKLRAYYQDRQEQSVSGQHLYCLSPNAPLAFRAMQAATSSYPTPMLEASSQRAIALAKGDPLPLDEDERSIRDRLSSVAMGHCTTEGVNVARIMGLNVESTGLPFDYNPDMFGEILKRTPGAQVEYPKRPPPSWEDVCRYT